MPRIVASVVTALAAVSLAAGCGPATPRTRRASTTLSSAALRATPAWSCLRIEDVTDGHGLTMLENLDGAGLRFYPLPASVAPRPGPGTRCVGLFEQPEVAAATLAGIADGDEDHPGVVRLQRLTASQVRALPPFARALAWVSAPMDFTGDESAGPLELERSPDGRTVLLYVQDSARGDLTEGRLHVLNARVGRVEVFAAWDFVLAEGRLIYGTARLLSDADTPAREGEAAATRELGVTSSALRSASFFDRSSASTQVVSLASYDPATGRAVELGQLGGGTLALAGAQVVATLRPLWWELAHADSSEGDATTLSRVEVLGLQGGRLRPVTGTAAGVAARRALDAKLRGRERALAEGSAAVGPEAQRMLTQLTPPETGQRAVGDLRLASGEVRRFHGDDILRLFDGQLRALTRDGSYGFARLSSSGRYVAMHFLPW
ncbi:MAG: hypothetical protein IT370_16690 [Deltaproteobacteria bacterium]|nr:hypothetical protein [Deltaproteobacteria bacterium]